MTSLQQLAKLATYALFIRDNMSTSHFANMLKESGYSDLNIVEVRSVEVHEYRNNKYNIKVGFMYVEDGCDQHGFIYGQHEGESEDKIIWDF